MQIRHLRNGTMRNLGAMALTFAALIAGGCVSTTPGARPDDMSAEEHRRASAREELVAQEHAEQYDPGATVYRPGSASGPEGSSGSDYNPTKRHFTAAKTHSRHAENHRAAAETLEVFEEGECGAFSPEVRAVCPLLGQLESFEDIEGGVRIRFLDDVNFEAAAAHVECHFAYGRTRGYEGMDNCPLYIRGLEVRRMADRRSLELISDDPNGVLDLRHRIDTHIDQSSE